MSSFLGPDGHLMTALTKLGKLIFANLLWLLCCVPVITVVPATTSFYYTVTKSIRRDCGYVAEDYVKESYAEGGGFDSLFFMNVHKSEGELQETAEKILNDSSCGDVFRVKGFLKKEDGQWLELNATRHEICIQPTKLGQEIMIVIGEKLNKEVIDEYWK